MDTELSSRESSLQEQNASSPSQGGDEERHSISLPTDFAMGIEAAFPRAILEGCRRVECVRGQIPEFVRGTYYLNGPARFAAGDVAYQHWLDGDGMICALHFAAAETRLTNRYIRSIKFEAERQAGRALFRGFGTGFPGSRLNRVNNGLESPVNVSVYSFGNHLLAFGEQGLPWELDPRTLETRDRFTFNGRLNEASPFSAHPKFDVKTQEMFNFGIFFSAQEPRLYLYCLDAEGARYRKAVPLEYPCSVHDFSLSRRFAIFYLSPYLLDLSGILREGRTVIESLKWMPERGSRLLVVDRSTAEVAASIPVGHRYCLHLMNSFEQGDSLVVDLLEFDAPIYSEYQPIPDLFQTVAQGGPVRFVIDLRKKELVDRIVLPCLCSPDFPSIDPRRSMQNYDEFWMLGISSAGKPGRKFFDQLVHGSWSRGESDTYQSPPMCYLGGEPVFINAPESDEAVVLCQEFDASTKTSYFLMFDAGHVSRGPIARIAAGQLLHLGFHAIFHPER